MPPIQIAAAGDAALLVSVPQVIDARLNAWCVAFAEAIAERYGAAVRDAVVGYASVTVYFDPLLVSPEWMERELHELAADLPGVPLRSGTVVDVPVLYGGEMGPDIEEVARFGGCDVEDVIARHSAITYRVYLVGIRAGLRLSRHGRSADCRTASSEPAPGGAGRLGGDCQEGRPGSTRTPLPEAGTSSAARRCCRSTPPARARPFSSPVIRSGSVRSRRPNSRPLRPKARDERAEGSSARHAHDCPGPRALGQPASRHSGRRPDGPVLPSLRQCAGRERRVARRRWRSR